MYDNSYINKVYIELINVASHSSKFSGAFVFMSRKNVYLFLIDP